MKIIVERYNSKDRSAWDEFIDIAKNSTFLFKRNFMEYHDHKYVDFSLIIYNHGNIIAVLPANLENKNIVTSHSGLTYGGFVVKKSIKLNLYLIIIKKVLLFLNELNIKTLKYKAIPIFYYSLLSQEEEYAFFLLKANNYRTETSLSIKYSSILPFQKRRLRSIKKAEKYGLIINDENSFKTFWEDILMTNLKKKYKRNPTHSLIEIENLADKFPNSIRQFNVYQNKCIVAGCTIFETETVAHVQYISSNDIGRKTGAIDKLFNYLILTKYKDKEYFDFGTCNGDGGDYINHGLLDWKEGFGGRTFVHKFYSIDTSNYKMLDVAINNKII